MGIETAEAAGAPLVSVIIVSWNTCGLLRDCLSSVYEKTAGLEFEVILVDNASSDGSAAMVRREFPLVRIIQNEDNKGFVGGNNQALDIARGRYALLLNSDTILLDNAIAAVAGFAETHPEGAVFGCKVLNADMSVQRSCFMYPSALNMVLYSSYLYKLFPKSRFFGRQLMTWWDFDDEREVQTVSGCFSMVRMAAIRAVGKMNPLFFFYGDDPDWCYRFSEAGWKIMFTPAGRIIHYGGQSTKARKRAFRLQLHGAELLFTRLHRNAISFIISCAQTSLFFLLRAPFWAAKALLKPSSRKESLETAGTYLIGALLSAFDWTKLLMNREAVRRYLKFGDGSG
jgi:GT2 family glycosyltransferase